MVNLKNTLMERDGITAQEADEQIAEARNRMFEMLANGESPYDICEEEFGLEPDYLDDLLF